MCGIAGALQPNYSDAEWQQTLLRMGAAIQHRGPDDQGIWWDTKEGVGLAHQRLSILDLSPEGRQPMMSDSGRYIIAYNGEVYNFQELRKELESVQPKWRGHSDTEVILAAVEAWGVEKAVCRFAGMFAFAIWDCKERLLSLVRDRLGIKPLFYGWCKGAFIFGSELKALRAHPSFELAINRDALSLFLRHNYIPEPFSIYQGIYKLRPGHILCISIDQASRVDSVASAPYWSAREVVETGQANLFKGTEIEAVDYLDSLLQEIIQQHMVSDVPLGAFLSGGIDSSTVVALMQVQSNRPVKTFSIGFHETGYNEAEYAKKVAEHLGTDHTELYVKSEDAIAVIPRLPELYDEPFSDSSQIPTFLVSELARQYVTVSLSGDGGDELFAGYSRYALACDIWNKIRWIPGSFQQALGKAISAIPPELLDKGFAWLNPILSKYGRVGSVGDKLHKFTTTLGWDNPDLMYSWLVSHWKEPSTVVLKSHELPTVLTDSRQWASLPDFTHRMMYLDLVSYLPGDILTKVDRASMAVGLEARVPVLDHRIVEFAWRLPLSMKVKNGQGKWILRQVLYRYVPKELIERPKMGFGVPIDTWLRGPLREWAEDLLDERRLKEEGFFNPAPIRQKWEEHLSGKFDWHYYLWDVLMFQAWLRFNG